MSGLSVAIVAFLLALVLMSFAFAGGAVIVAIPVALIGIAVVGALEMKRRREQTQQIQTFRDEAKTESVDFTARDQETLASD